MQDNVNDVAAFQALFESTFKAAKELADERIAMSTHLPGPELKPLFDEITTTPFYDEYSKLFSDSDLKPQAMQLRASQLIIAACKRNQDRANNHSLTSMHPPTVQYVDKLHLLACLNEQVRSPGPAQLDYNLPKEAYNLEHQVNLDSFPTIYHASANATAEELAWVEAANKPIPWDIANYTSNHQEKIKDLLRLAKEAGGLWLLHTEGLNDQSLLQFTATIADTEFVRLFSEFMQELYPEESLFPARIELAALHLIIYSCHADSLNTCPVPSNRHFDETIFFKRLNALFGDEKSRAPGLHFDYIEDQVDVEPESQPATTDNQTTDLKPSTDQHKPIQAPEKATSKPSPFSLHFVGACVAVLGLAAVAFALLVLSITSLTGTAVAAIGGLMAVGGFTLFANTPSDEPPPLLDAPAP